MIFCVPPINSCGHAHDGHHCCRSVGHSPLLKHACFCGELWGVDSELEAAIKCYMEFYSIPYVEEPYFTSMSAAIAACAPLNSSWRKMVRISQGRPLDATPDAL